MEHSKLSPVVKRWPQRALSAKSYDWFCFSASKSAVFTMWKRLMGQKLSTMVFNDPRAKTKTVLEMKCKKDSESSRFLAVSDSWCILSQSTAPSTQAPAWLRPRWCRRSSSRWASSAPCTARRRPARIRRAARGAPCARRVGRRETCPARKRGWCVGLCYSDGNSSVFIKTSRTR